MSRILLLFSFFTIGIIFTSQAQADKKNTRSNSFEPYAENAQADTNSAKQKKSRKSKKNKQSFRSWFKKDLENKKEEFYELMEANAKRDRKMAKEMKKPQYSDPSYFGHKKKPKKRKPGKRKLCKECGIVH
ncbi:hypothetical protein LVD15_05575 [Fulvivirga maritima]|uniref:hypothetical protein n=1 Tax=Fulvivirga maritima TaxID=2904247 RepID=UPI001F227C06|nr:hypothetical protein [Fulvivirga maritima]UII27892.1 hypothetical protein LVD15_05575 [Fulvivirga maritima]